MSNVLPTDISEYLQTLLLLKAAQELEPVRQLALNYELLLKHYPHAAQQVQDLLIPVARKNYSALPERLNTTLKDLESFHQLLLSVRHESSRWGTEAECDAIQEKVTLLVLPFDELYDLKESHLQRARAAEQEERERQHQEDERLRKEAEDSERQRLESEERRLREIAAQAKKKALFVFFSFIFVTFGILTLAIIDRAHEKAALESVVQAQAPKPIVIAQQKKTKKKADRVPLEDYLKGIENACDFRNVTKQFLSLTLEPVKRIYGPLEIDYQYEYPPNKNIVKKFPELYKSVPIVEDKGEYSEASAKINGVFYGLAASKLIEGIGHENGIAFFTIVFDSPDAETVLKKKLKFKTQWREINGGYELGVTFNVKNGKTHMTCDWSD